MDNHDPVWNESFTFHLENPQKESIYCVLMDHDDGSDDNSLGQVVLPILTAIEAVGGRLENPGGYPTGKKTGKLWVTVEWKEHRREASVSGVSGGSVRAGTGMHGEGCSDPGVLTCVIKSGKDLVSGDIFSNYVHIW